MRKRTSTQKINEILVNDLLQVTGAEIHYKTSSKTKKIDAAKIKEYFTKLCESEIFADVIGWHYEKNHETGQYTIETGRLNPHSETTIIVYLNANDSTNLEEHRRFITNGRK